MQNNNNNTFFVLINNKIVCVYLSTGWNAEFSLPIATTLALGRRKGECVTNGNGSILCNGEWASRGGRDV